MHPIKRLVWPLTMRTSLRSALQILDCAGHCGKLVAPKTIHNET